MVFIGTGLVKLVTNAHYKQEKYIQCDAIDSIKCERITHVKIFGISNTSVSEPTGAAQKFLSKAKSCIQYIEHLYAKNANDKLLSYIGITPNKSPSESIKIKYLTTKNCLFYDLQLGNDFPETTDLTIHGGNYEFIENATHVKHLNIYETAIPTFNIIKFVRNNLQLVALVIGTPLYKMDSLRVHNALFNIREFELLVCNDISVNTTTKTIISDDIETFDAYDGGNLLRCTDAIKSTEELPAFLSRIHNVKDQFDMISLNVTSFSLIALVLDNLKSNVLRVTVAPDLRDVYEAITRNGNHYSTDMSDASLLASLPQTAESLKIYYFNSSTRFDPDLLTPFSKLRTLNIVSHTTSQPMPNSDSVLSKNRLLNDISLKLDLAEHLKTLRRLETDLFEHDIFDMYDDFFKLKKLEFFTIRFNAEQKSAAEYILEHFYTIGLTDWAFKINYEHNQINGVKVSQEFSFL